MTNAVDGVIHLSTDALVKAINDEYALILVSERNNLQKALAMGEKLVALRPRIAPKHGDWQTELAKHCQDLSYETANLYMRFWNNQDKLKDYAASKNVTVTDMTIQEARTALAKPKSDSDKGKPRNVVNGAATEPGNEPNTVTLPPDEQVKCLELDYGDMFEALKRKYDRDDLLELTKRLAADLGMVLMPLAQSQELMEALGVPAQMTQ